MTGPLAKPLAKLQENYKRAVDVYRELLHRYYDPIRSASGGCYAPLPITEMAKMEIVKAKADMELARDAVTVYMLEMILERAQG